MFCVSSIQVGLASCCSLRELFYVFYGYVELSRARINILKENVRVTPHTVHLHILLLAKDQMRGIRKVVTWRRQTQELLLSLRPLTSSLPAAAVSGHDVGTLLTPTCKSKERPNINAFQP